MLLQQKKLSLETLDDSGKAVLHHAAKNGILEFFESLAKHRSDWPKDLPNTCEATPLWLACRYGHISLVKFLLEKFTDTVKQLKQKNDWKWNLSLEVYCEDYQKNNDCGVQLWQNALIAVKLSNEEFTIENFKKAIVKADLKNPDTVTLLRFDMAISLEKDQEFLKTHQAVIIKTEFEKQVKEIKRNKSIGSNPNSFYHNNFETDSVNGNGQSTHVIHNGFMNN